MSDGESDGGETSKASWVGSASDGSSDSDQDIIFRCFIQTLLIVKNLDELFNFSFDISILFIVCFCGAI